jgi:outer membrane receptor protein involved in Fe transport
MNHSIYYLNRFINTLLAAIVAVLLFSPAPAHAGQTGKISGSVKDAKNGEPIVGATVILQGTRIGAATDAMGDYYINNVSPGTYNLAVSIVGYQTMVVKNVIVKIDLTTNISAKLVPTEVVGQEVIIQAERPLVQKDLTSSAVTVSSDEIKVMPVENINQVINLQAGVVGGHFRGGRAGEVAYLIDGLPINNPANGGAGFTPENSSVREMEVISGTFNAEYGQAMSGVVNIVTQDGGDKYAGSVSVYMGDYFTKHSDIFQNLDKLDITRSKNFQASLSGPTQIDRHLTFFLTGRFQDDQGYLYGRRVFKTTDGINPLMFGGTQLKDEYGFFKNLPGYVTDESGNVYRITQTGDSSFVPMNPYRKYSLNGKLTYSIGDFKVSYGYFWEDNFSKGYNHAYQLTPDGVMNNYSTNFIHSILFSHVISMSTYQTLKFSVNSFRAKGYLYADPFDPRYVDPTLGTPVTNNTFRAGGNDGGRYTSNTQSVIGQYSISSQVSKEHKVTFGVEGRIHQLLNHGMNIVNATENQTDSAGNAIFTLGYRNLGTIGNQMYDKRPREASAYIQDKMEYENMIINAGVRFDYFDPNGKLLVDLTNPVTPDTTGQSSFPMRSASKKYQISPRLGVSFPITDQGIIHFSYGHFFQIPTFENLYNNSDYLVNPGGSLSSMMGNPDLEAQRTVSYELGLQQALFENIGIDFTVYYRDIRNLLTMEIVKTTQGDQYARFVNGDYGSVRGFILSFDRRFANYFSLRADYTYQIAEGDASDPMTVYYNNQSDPPIPTNKQLVPLNWDQRSTLNLNLTVGEMGNWTAGMIFQYGVGFPYTEATRVSLLRFENGAVKPSTYNLDLRAEKNFSYAGLNLTLSLLVYNVLDTKNEYGVNSASGRANVDPFLSESIQKIVGINTVAQYQNNPANFSAPRQVRLGLNLGF